MKIFGIPYKPRHLVYLAGDVFAALVAVLLAHVVRYGAMAPEAHPLAILQENPAGLIFFLSSNLLLLFVADTYNTELDFRRPPQILRLWLVVNASMLVQMLAYFLTPDDNWGRGIAGLSCLFLGVALTGWRALASGLRPVPVFRRRTLIVGDGEAGKLLAEVIRANPEHEATYQVLGFLSHPRFGHRRRGDQTPDPQSLPALELPAPLLGTVQDVKEVVAQARVDLVILAIRGNIGSELARDLLVCKARGVSIEEMPTIYKRITGKVPILHLSDSWFIFGPVFAGSSRQAAAAQRVMDILLSLIGLALSAPVVALAALAVKLESRGPAFYLQERLGRNEMPFSIIKLRTMVADAEAKTGAVWSQGASDPRVTRVGRFLRRTRIDELPQFWNVLRGDMSIVGPRPEREHFVRQLEQAIPFYALRFAVKPGVTGWAQVNYRYGASVDEAAEKLCYELYAIQELGPVLYLMIVLKTVQTMLLRPGS